jgi:acyl-CoA hydrolase
MDMIVTEVGSVDPSGLSTGDQVEAIISISAEEHRPASREVVATLA